MRDAAYKPTAGMIAALADTRAADEADLLRCQRRGLLDFHGERTLAGERAFALEVRRLKDLAHG